MARKGLSEVTLAQREGERELCGHPGKEHSSKGNSVSRNKAANADDREKGNKVTEPTGTLGTKERLCFS